MNPEKDFVEQAYELSEWIDSPICIRWDYYSGLPVVSYSLYSLLSKMKVEGKTAPDFYKYFCKKYYEKNKITYPTVSFDKDCMFFKSKVMDWFYLNGYKDGDIFNFIDYCIEKEPLLKASYLPWQITDYIRDVLSKRKDVVEPSEKQERVLTKKEIELAHLAEKEILEYYGQGYFDEQLTKEQYWVGLKWRITNMSRDDLKKLKAWQMNRYNNTKFAGVVDRLEAWKKVFYMIDKTGVFDLMERFYAVESVRLNISVEEVKLKYCRE